LLVAIRTPPHRSGILHHHRFVSVTEHSGFASNQVLLETLADATAAVSIGPAARLIWLAFFGMPGPSCAGVARDP
jgi:hypothetical protein